MDVSVTRTDGLTLLAAEGRLDGVTARGFENAVISAAPQEGGALAVDFSSVSYVSSAGLRSLLVLARRCAAAGCGFAAVGFCGQPADVFRMSGFTKAVKHFGTAEEAEDALLGQGEDA